MAGASEDFVSVFLLEIYGYVHCLYIVFDDMFVDSSKMFFRLYIFRNFCSTPLPSFHFFDEQSNFSIGLVVMRLLASVTRVVVSSISNDLETAEFPLQSRRAEPL